MKKISVIVIIITLLIINSVSVYFLFINEKAKTDGVKVSDNLPCKEANATEEPEPIKNWKEYQLISHAGGGLHGTALTNTKEALIESYLMGNKVIELDFLLTSDNKLIASHDYDYLSSLTGKKVNENWALSEILRESVSKYQTLLSWNDVVDLLIMYPDMYIITDTKNSAEKEVARAFNHIYMIAEEKDITVLERVIPQIYTPAMYDYIEAIYNFDEYVWTLYQYERITTKEIITLLENIPKIKGLSMPIKAYSWQVKTPKITANFINKIKKKNVLFYIHTLNDISEIDKFYKMGAWGFYTDYISESYLKQNNLLQYEN